MFPYGLSLGLNAVTRSWQWPPRFSERLSLRFSSRRASTSFCHAWESAVRITCAASTGLMHFSLSYSPIPELPATAPSPACSRQSASGSSACGSTVDKRFAYRTYWTGPESWSGPEENCLESERWTVLCDARIDGKASLIRALSCGDARRERDLSRANTANLILAAFLKWGRAL